MLHERATILRCTILPILLTRLKPIPVPTE